jgi:hypothetical protein
MIITAVIYNELTKPARTGVTIGYPHAIFKNAFGDIIAISGGLK